MCLEGNKEDGLIAAGLLPVNAGGRCEERPVDDGWLPTGMMVGRCAVLRLATKVGVVFATLVSSGTAWVLDEVETPLGEVTLAE